MERATVCLDEIDKVTPVVGGKPYVTGINIQQALLTLIEGETRPPLGPRPARRCSHAGLRSTPGRCSSSAPARSRPSTTRSSTA